MRELFRDAEHLVRLALLFVAAIAVFLVVRGLAVPEDFGELGHYRTGALADNRARPIAFAGRAACIECHSDVEDLRKGGAHAGIGCEACHGPLAAHAADPTTAAAARPDSKAICLVCHLRNVAKPKGFPQIDPKDHGEGAACVECHKPHAPGIS